MTWSVSALRPKDDLRQNAEPVAALYRDLGTQAADQVVSRALGELALTVAGLALRVRQGRLDDLDRDLRRLARLAEPLGMTGLATVAQHLRTCVAGDDVTAFAAVWARLMRVAEGSLAPRGADGPGAS